MQAVGLDFAAEMLTDAKRREREQQVPGTVRRAASVEWVLGDATQLPFEDASFDAATMGYGLRNVSPNKQPPYFIFWLLYNAAPEVRLRTCWHSKLFAPS